jgi:hypothetical protein
MKEMIREYFNQMLEDGIDIEGAKDNLLDIVIEIASEFEEE